MNKSSLHYNIFQPIIQNKKTGENLLTSHISTSKLKKHHVLRRSLFSLSEKNKNFIANKSQKQSQQQILKISQKRPK